MHVDLDAFFVSVERVLNPALQGKPVIVGNAVFGRGVVAAASYEARALGVRSAMPMRQALERCPGAVVVNGSYATYQEYSRRFLGLLQTLSPAVEPLSLDEAFVDLTGTERLLGPAREVARALRARIREELGLPASAGIGPSRVVAKVATDAAKPDGQLEVLPGQEAAFLAMRPVRDLPGIGPVTAERLDSLGIHTLGALQRADPAALAAALGPGARSLPGRAAGQDPSPVQARARPRSISRETTFEEDVTNGAWLQSVVELLADQVAMTMRQQGLAARTVDVKYRVAGFRTYTMQQALGQPQASSRVVADTAVALLRRLRDAHPEPVRLIGTGVTGLQEQATQLDLFAPDSAAMRLDQTLDELRERFGFGAVMRGSAVGLDRRLRPSLHHPDGL